MQHEPSDAPRPTTAYFARRWAMPSLVVASTVVCELAGDTVRVAFRYQRDAVLDGEWWRLLTGNLAHLGPRHLALNLAGFGLVMALAGRSLDGWRGGLAALTSMLAVGMGLLCFAPGVAWYVGLSGVLHGLLVCVALEAIDAREQRGWGVVLLVMLIAKIGWERFAGPLPLTAAAAGGPVIVAAHLYGAIGGGGATVMSRLISRSMAQRARADAQV